MKKTLLSLALFIALVPAYACNTCTSSTTTGTVNVNGSVSNQVGTYSSVSGAPGTSASYAGSTATATSNGTISSSLNQGYGTTTGQVNAAGAQATSIGGYANNTSTGAGTGGAYTQGNAASITSTNYTSKMTNANGTVTQNGVGSVNGVVSMGSGPDGVGTNGRFAGSTGEMAGYSMTSTAALANCGQQTNTLAANFTDNKVASSSTSMTGTDGGVFATNNVSVSGSYSGTSTITNNSSVLPMEEPVFNEPAPKQVSLPSGPSAIFLGKVSE
jgi:hypothetical protein